MRPPSATVVGVLLAFLVSMSAWAQSPVQMSILPSARSGAPNEALTFFATIVNSGDVALTCQPQFGGFFPGAQGGQAKYFPWDGTTITGSANQAVEIEGGGRQDYVVEITVPNVFTGQLFSNIQCSADGVTATVPRLRLVNDFRVNIAAGTQPDIIMIGDTLSRDGVARVGATGPRAALMTVAAVNIGDAASNLLVAPNISTFGSLHRGSDLTICEINAQGICLAPESETVAISNWATNETRLFAVRLRVAAPLGLPFYPDILRLQVLVGDDPVAANLSAPSNHASVNPQFGTSTAVDVSPATAFVGHAGPVQQCFTQPLGDTGGDFGRSIGYLVVIQSEGAGGALTANGFLQFSDFQFEARNSDIVPVGLTAPAMSGPGELTRFGRGTGNLQQSDDTSPVPVNVNVNNGGVGVRWFASFATGDLSQDGRARCVSAPADPATSPNAAVELLAGFFGGYAASPPVNDADTLQADPSSHTVNAGSTPIFEGIVVHQPPIADLTESQIAQMYDNSMAAFVTAGQVGYEAVIVPTQWRVVDADPAINCGILGYTGTAQTAGGAQATEDGGVSVLRDFDEDPDELGDGECIQ